MSDDVAEPLNKRNSVKSAALLALDDMMSQAYPEIHQNRRELSEAEYSTKLLALRNRPNAGRNWYLMRQRFPIGILALVPTGEEYKIQNYR